MHIKRHALPLLREHLRESPVTWIRGARQVGKSTLAQAATEDDRAYVTFDDDTYLRLARADAQGFVLGLPEAVTLDEVQRVPEIFRAIKLAVDRDRRPGRFLLTGSTNVLALPRASESLAGRMQVLDLEPLAQAEIEGGPGDFLTRVFERSWAGGTGFA